jgi:hypothetical protein
MDVAKMPGQVLQKRLVVYTPNVTAGFIVPPEMLPTAKPPAVMAKPMATPKNSSWFLFTFRHATDNTVKHKRNVNNVKVTHWAK